MSRGQASPGAAAEIDNFAEAVRLNKALPWGACIDWNGASYLVAPARSLDAWHSFFERLPPRDPAPSYAILLRWTNTSTDGPISQFEPFTLTYSFCLDGTAIQNEVFGESNDPSEIHALLDANFPGGRAAWKSFFAEVLNRWGDFIPITYVEVADDGATFPISPGVVGVRGDIRFAMHTIDPPNSPTDLLAYARTPSDSIPDRRGDVVFDSGNLDDFVDPFDSFRILRNTIAHEHGHGLGMYHVKPFDGTKLMEPFLFSGSPTEPQQDDIRGAQRWYGDAREENKTTVQATDFGPLPTPVGVQPVPLQISDVALETAVEEDHYAFTVPGGSLLDLAVSPVGFPYSVAEEPGPPLQFVDAQAINDLAFDLIGTDGSTVLATAAGASIGQTESIAAFPIAAAGKYFLRVRSATSTDDVQRYQLSLAYFFKANGASFAADTLPAQVYPNQSILFGLTMMNDGNTTWTAGAGYSLAVTSDSCGAMGGATRLPMDPSARVASGQAYQFVGGMTAPGTLGPCSFEFRMVEEGVEFFGATAMLSTEVVAEPNAARDWNEYE